MLKSPSQTFFSLNPVPTVSTPEDPISQSSTQGSNGQLILKAAEQKDWNRVVELASATKIISENDQNSYDNALLTAASNIKNDHKTILKAASALLNVGASLTGVYGGFRAVHYAVLNDSPTLLSEILAYYPQAGYILTQITQSYGPSENAISLTTNTSTPVELLREHKNTLKNAEEMAAILDIHLEQPNEIELLEVTRPLLTHIKPIETNNLAELESNTRALTPPMVCAKA